MRQNFCNFITFFALSFCISSFAYADFDADSDDSAKNFPNISGKVLFELRSDRILSINQAGVSDNNSFLNIEPDISLNIDKNWSIETNWKILPLSKRDEINPERYRTILNQDRGILNLDNTGVLVQELKVQFQNDDMKIFAGKFNPSFGTMFRKSKRIGVYNTDFAQDYEIRGRIGAEVAALLEDSEISVSTFFNDISGLSGSSPYNMGAEKSSSNLSGNTTSLSSYTISTEGQNFFGIENLYYNAGYRSLAVNSAAGRKRELGYVIGSEYLYKTGINSSLVPVIELVKINNFTGEQGRNAIYKNLALIGKYSNWTASASAMHRDIKRPQRSINNHDRIYQLTIGYKFANNITLDITRGSIKEDGKKAVLIGTLISYLYSF